MLAITLPLDVVERLTRLHRLPNDGWEDADAEALATAKREVAQVRALAKGDME